LIRIKERQRPLAVKRSPWQDDAVTTAIRLELPRDVADELVAERAAVRPLVTRGSGVSDVVQFLLDGVNTGSSVVTVAVAGGGLYTVARRLLDRMERKSGGVVIVVLRGRGGSEELEIPPDASEEEMAALIVAAIHTVADAHSKD
jgi:hypothetical protein